MMSAKIRLYATCTTPMMHLIFPQPFFLLFLLGSTKKKKKSSTAVLREIENNAYAKFGAGGEGGGK